MAAQQGVTCVGCGAPFIDLDGSPILIRDPCQECNSDEPPHGNDHSPCRCHFCASCNRNNFRNMVIGTSAGPGFQKK